MRIPGGYSSKAAACCPTAFQKRKQVQPLHPKSGANQSEKPGEAASPARKERLIAQQQAAKEGAPDLPADGVGTVAEKIGNA